MKKAFLFILMFSAFSANALTVNDAKVADGNLEISVTYGGGCEDHEFELEIGPYCLESMPVQCSATIKDVSETPDFCEALITETVTFSLEKEGLTDSYFDQASLTISADGDEQNSVTVRLPAQ